MGGNALKSVKGKGRMSPEEYERVKEQVLKQLRMWYAQVRVPAPAFGKLDHGDVDVVCLPHHANDAPIDPFKQLGSTEVVRNAHLISFAYLGRQIDLTHVRTQQALDFKLVFNSYGIVGSVLVSMCRSVGLLINSKRLAVHLPHLSHKLFLADDIWQVMAFLGLSGDAWMQGFANAASLFHWFASSRFFNLSNVMQNHPEMFANLVGQELLKGMGNDPLATKALQDCVLDGVPSADPIFDKRTCQTSQDDVLTEALRFFDKEHEYQALLSIQAQSQQVKLKFNGELVLRWTGCSRSQDVGRLLRAFKERFSSSDILGMDEDTIKKEILSLSQTLSIPGVLTSS